MQIVTDLHLHSKYSRAVSQKLDLTEIASWASKKGISIVSTADWTHPVWFKLINADLVETGEGLYKLKNGKFPNIKFILSTEISSIYSQGGQTRRVHNLVFSPSLKTCEKIIAELKNRGANLMADGRPILGLSSREVLELVKSADPETFLIPCHVWTPWFSLYGSKSGFNSIEECFGNYAKEIYAVETGLSSDPVMNWQIGELQTRSIVSFSDAHSGPKLGREATVLVSTNQELKIKNEELRYQDIIDAFKQNPQGKLKIGYTIEFFPEEGKYHWSGHRSCGIRYSPADVKKKGIICPVCGRPLTIGVENRVADLSSKTYSPEDLLTQKNSHGTTFVTDKEKSRRPFVSIIPLMEVLAEVNNGSQVKAFREYENLVPALGTEFDILLKLPLEAIEKAGGPKLREAVEIIRDRRVFVDPGYDGVFGVVKIFGGEKREIKAEEVKNNSTNNGQPTLF